VLEVYNSVGLNKNLLFFFNSDLLFIFPQEVPIANRKCPNAKKFLQKYMERFLEDKKLTMALKPGIDFLNQFLECEDIDADDPTKVVCCQLLAYQLFSLTELYVKNIKDADGLNVSINSKLSELIVELMKSTLKNVLRGTGLCSVPRNSNGTGTEPDRNRTETGFSEVPELENSARNFLRKFRNR
jgi:hypothetical protein